MHIPRHSLRLFIAAAAIACVAAIPAPAAAATNSCRAESIRSGSTILLATSQAVVFRSKRYKTEVACDYKDRRIVVIGGFVCCQLPRYALASGGRYLGYAIRLDQADFEVDEMGVVDLKTGKRQRYSGQSAATTVDTNGYVKSFHVTSRGTLAWLQEWFVNEAHPEDNDYAVRSIAPGKDTTELDTGKTIDPSSFAVSSGGKTAFWVKDGATKSAPIG
jgi:hypothetical protein